MDRSDLEIVVRREREATSHLCDLRQARTNEVHNDVYRHDTLRPMCKRSPVPLDPKVRVLPWATLPGLPGDSREVP